MSTPAHEPLRVGPRRVGPDRVGQDGADSASANKVAPRRNASDAIESTGIQYDGDEVPVLIRLPNLRELGTTEPQPAPSTQRRHTRIDPANHSSKVKSDKSKTKKSKRPIEPETNNTKLVIGGLLGGVLIAVALMLLSSGGNSEPEEQDGWATPEEAELLAQEPEISIPTEGELASGNEPPSLYPGFATEPPTPETAQLAGGEFDQSQVGVPYYDEPIAATENINHSSQSQPADAWPIHLLDGTASDDQHIPNADATADGLGQSQDSFNAPYPATNTSSQEDYRSSMYPSQTESYRTGMLDTDRSSNNAGSSILDGNIEIPPTTRYR